MDQLPSIGARKEERQQLRQQRTGHVGFASPHPVPPGQPVPPAISLVTCRGVRTPAVSLVFTQAASRPHHPPFCEPLRYNKANLVCEERKTERKNGESIETQRTRAGMWLRNPESLKLRSSVSACANEDSHNPMPARPATTLVGIQVCQSMNSENFT
ncbi:hypothetical protein CB1_001421004 [Camelus ferus]|nr:hypothetical protein CB1_001421004 [Camelus ferus]